MPETAVSYNLYGDSVFVVIGMKSADGKPYLGVRQQFAGTAGATMALLGLMSEAVAIEAEHAGLGAGEERRAQQQKDQQADEKAGV